MKRSIKLFLIVFFIFLLMSLIILFSRKIGVCTDDTNIFCLPRYSLDFGKPMVFFSFVMIVLSLVLSLFKQEVIASWYKLTVLIPFALVWVFTTPTFCGGIICADRNFVAWVSASIFSLISIIFVVVKTLRHKI